MSEGADKVQLWEDMPSDLSTSRINFYDLTKRQNYLSDTIRSETQRITRQMTIMLP